LNGAKLVIPEEKIKMEGKVDVKMLQQRQANELINLISLIRN
jgi:hypothetical protein